MANTNQKGRAIRAESGRTLMLAQFSILLAIEAIFCFTILGSIPMPGGLVATLSMLPVIITAMTMGVKAGSLMGFFFGLFSFLVWTFMPPNPMFAFQFTPFYSFGEVQGNFWSLVICFVPRILVGTVTGLTVKALAGVLPQKKILIAFPIAAILGSMTNTIGVLGLTWLFFGQQVTDLAGTAVAAVVGGLILTNGIPEAVLSAVVCPAVSVPVKTILKRSVN
ncbi:MAG: ECF transporter S component [Oscillospiraceae bacterium]|nr:ECF transporter S component [Oscillospiraceae bacterium]